MKNKVLKNIFYLVIAIVFIIGMKIFIENVGPKLLYDFIIWLGEDKI